MWFVGNDMVKFKRVVGLESSVVLTLYIAVALAGYYQFGNDVNLTSQLHTYTHTQPFFHRFLVVLD